MTEATSFQSGLPLLSLAEATEIASGAVHALAEREGVKILTIKGDSFAAVGLRERRVSMDVDILVEPVSFDQLVSLLEAWGWKRRAGVIPNQYDAPHSVTLVHPYWPCDLDIHRFFPGFLEEPEVVFEELWARRLRIESAHQDCWMPDATASGLVMTLNDLRSRRWRETDSLRVAWFEALSASEQQHAWALMQATGSDLTVGHVLRSPSDRDGRPQRPNHNWPRLMRAASGDHGKYFWQLAFRRSGLMGRLGVLAVSLRSIPRLLRTRKRSIFARILTRA